VTAEDSLKTYRQAERRLQEMLFGDGVYTAGLVKGEEARLEVTSALRRMRQAFDSALAESAAQTEATEAHADDLEQDLRRLASGATRDRRTESGA
jgi:hypothetical protein